MKKATDNMEASYPAKQLEKRIRSKGLRLLAFIVYIFELA